MTSSCADPARPAPSSRAGWRRTRTYRSCCWKPAAPTTAPPSARPFSGRAISRARPTGRSMASPAHINNRSILFSMGKVLGGGSSINVMVWARGHKRDWDLFAAESGDPAWGYDSVLDIYRRIEDWHGAADPNHRGSGGPVFVQPAPRPNPLAPATLEAARSLGIPTFENRQRAADGRRWRRRHQRRSCPHGPAAVDLPLLCLDDDGPAEPHGRHRGARHPRHLRRSACERGRDLPGRTDGPGRRTFGSHSLARRRQHAESTDAVRHRRPGRAGGAFDSRRPASAGRRPESAGPCRLRLCLGISSSRWRRATTCRKRSSTGRAAPDSTRRTCSSARPRFRSPRRRMPPASACPRRDGRCSAPSRSRKGVDGYALTGRDPGDPILIEANTLADPDDFQTALACVELCREIGNAAPLRPFARREVMPGNSRARRSRISSAMPRPASGT